MGLTTPVISNGLLLLIYNCEALETNVTCNGTQLKGHRDGDSSPPHCPPPSYPRTYQDSDVEEPINKLQNLPAQASSPLESDRHVQSKPTSLMSFIPTWILGQFKSGDNAHVEKPLALPGESQGRRSRVGCCLWGRTELDTTEVT